MALVGLVKKVVPRHVDPGFVVNSVCLVKNRYLLLPQLRGGSFGGSLLPDWHSPLQAGKTSPIPCRWQVEKRYRLEVEMVVDGYQFLQGYLNKLHKSSSNQFLIQSFYLDITFQLLPHPTQLTRKAAGG